MRDAPFDIVLVLGPLVWWPKVIDIQALLDFLYDFTFEGAKERFRLKYHFIVFLLILNRCFLPPPKHLLR